MHACGAARRAPHTHAHASALPVRSDRRSRDRSAVFYNDRMLIPNDRPRDRLAAAMAYDDAPNAVLNEAASFCFVQKASKTSTCGGGAGRGGRRAWAEGVRGGRAPLRGGGTAAVVAEEQVELLREAFAACAYPRPPAVAALAERAGLDVEAVRRWFRTRRSTVMRAVVGARALGARAPRRRALVASTALAACCVIC